ncbi:holo-ACP synthase [Reinekea thalattae]|uniref:Holo-[acyl-carrier-protein] synthase n=1 Tax=Reinekea thalattae TaxID=2593301 RepID=A0A5C8Z859_9GAMM|nr:holo-ACP synthase [Reinekea thalattae]TXR53080.1 holo-ACP synthase [Reinekea thalattae]
MKGIGTDIVQIERIEQTLAKQGERFIRRILTEPEQALYHQRHQSIRFLANRFAAKEAISKALGTGISGGIRFTDIEVIPNAQGMPCVSLYNQAKLQLDSLQAEHVLVSLSDEKAYCVAFATCL